GADALKFDLGKSFKERAGTQCLLMHTTLAARRAAVHVADVPAATTVLEPLVVQTNCCAFLNPFPLAANRAGVLSYDGLALARGVVLWQGEADAFDKRLQFRAAPAGAVPDRPQPHAAWPALWGSPGDRRPQL